MWQLLYTDQDLIVAMQNGDQQSFELLYERYWQEVYTLIYRRIGDKETTKDIVQNIFVNLWISRDKIMAEKTLGPLLGVMARKKALSWYKQ